MKLSLLFFLLFFGSSPLKAQETYTLTIEFTHIKSNNGSIYIGLHNNENDFLKKTIKGDIVKIINNEATCVFKELLKGEYAIAAFHDENKNKKMDTNFIGIPKEPFAVSNNAKGFMGPPKYKDAKFKITKDTYIQIKID